MNKEVGLWIDHREAILVILTDAAEEIQHFASNGNRRLRASNSPQTGGSEGLKQITPEDQRDRKFENTLNKFYDEIIIHLRDADSILIFGPGEAKGEFEKRLETEGLKEPIRGIETADRMTENQIVSRIREYYRS